MTAKKKLVLLFSALGVFTVSVVVALVAVFAAFTATADSGVLVTYTAKNIHATVAASYAVYNTTDASGGTYNAIKTADSLDIMTFTGAETGASTTQSFSAVSNLQLQINEVVYFRYVITNTDSSRATSFNVSATNTITTNSNLAVKYYVVTGTSSVTEGSGAEESFSWVNSLSLSGTTVAYGTPLTVYVRISVADSGADATFNGSFNFKLQII